MTSSIFLLSAIISCIYLIVKFIEMRFIIKENKPLKLLIRDTLVVYISIIVGNFILTEMVPTKIINNTPEVFTDNPGF